MSSYGSTHSGHTHPTYPPNPPTHQHQRPQPPYPTTPGPANNSAPSAFYPPPPPQHQGSYSTSPTTHFSNNQTYSTSPQQSFFPPQPQQPSHRRSSSHTYPTHPSTYPTQPPATAPIQIPVQNAPQPLHHRRTSHSSHYSSGNDEDKHDRGAQYGIDADTLRQYERRYAKDRRLEKRPTLGGSVMSVVRAIAGGRG